MYWVSTPSISTTTACRSVSAAQAVAAHPVIRIAAVIMPLNICRNTFMPSLHVGDPFGKIVIDANDRSPGPVHRFRVGDEPFDHLVGDPLRRGAAHSRLAFVLEHPDDFV